MRKILSIIILSAMVIGMFGLFGCTKKKGLETSRFFDKEPGTMLVDYFEKVVGTPEEMGYYELVLYTYSKSEVLLLEYTDGGLESEKLTEYLVPPQAAQDAFDVIEEYKVAGWSERSDTYGITGMSYVVRFPDGADGYIRASSESMPEDGRAAFTALRASLSRYLNEAYLKK